MPFLVLQDPRVAAEAQQPSLRAMPEQLSRPAPKASFVRRCVCAAVVLLQDPRGGGLRPAAIIVGYTNVDSM